MYKDDIWYRKLAQAVDEHRPDFTEKQLKQFAIEFMMRIAGRIKNYSDSCETCRDFQHTLNRMEEEFPELPDSKAQRQYQRKQLQAMAEHFANAHRLAPSRYYLMKYLRYGLIAGMLIGILLGFLILNDGMYILIGPVIGLVLGGLFGGAEDAKVRNEHRLI